MRVNFKSNRLPQRDCGTVIFSRINANHCLRGPYGIEEMRHGRAAQSFAPMRQMDNKVSQIYDFLTRPPIVYQIKCVTDKSLITLEKQKFMPL